VLSFKQFITEIAGEKKWWYDSKAGKAVKVSKSFHAQQVKATPKKFGLTAQNFKTDFEKSFPFPPSGDILFKQGWVEVTWVNRIGEAVFAGKDKAAVRKALTWFLDNIEPDPNQVRLRGRGTPKNVLSGPEIDQFAKTGNIGVNRTEIGRTLARFR